MDSTGQDIRFAELKDTVAELNRKIESLTKAFEESRAREAEKDHAIESLKSNEAEKDTEIAKLKEEVEYWKKKLFGKKSEKSNDFPGQLDLFNEAEEEFRPSSPEEVEIPEDNEEAEDQRDPRASKSRKKKQTNQEKYSNCRQRKEYLDVNEDQRTCPVCGTELEYIGEEFVRQEIHRVPGYIEVINYYSKNYGCPSCKQSGTELPYIIKGKDGKPHMMKGMASASTVAWIMYQKYCNSVPLYRQEKDWERLYGLKITRATFAAWIIRNAETFLKLLFDHMHRRLLVRQFLMGDETPLQVLHEPDRKAQTKSFMWVFRTGEDGGNPIILYHYTETRAGYNAADFLGDYSGYFMSDGYGGYNSLPHAKRCSCYAHVRRYLLDAIPKGKKDDYSEPAVQGYLYVEKLFIEEKRIRAKYKSPDSIRDARNKKERPILDAFFAWVDSQKPVKGTRFDKAITYIKNRKKYLMTYLENGRCSLTNNLTEQGCKSFVIGRKNWLFSDQPIGAHTSAIIYSLVETAKLNGVNPYYYLRYVLEKMSSLPSLENLDEPVLEDLMPWSSQLQDAIQAYEKEKE